MRSLRRLNLISTVHFSHRPHAVREKGQEPSFLPLAEPHCPDIFATPQGSTYGT